MTDRHGQGTPFTPDHIFRGPDDRWYQDGRDVTDSPLWWQCTQGHQWQAPLAARTGGTDPGCPMCTGQASAQSTPVPSDAMTAPERLTAEPRMVHAFAYRPDDAGTHGPALEAVRLYTHRGLYRIASGEPARKLCSEFRITVLRLHGHLRSAIVAELAAVVDYVVLAELAEGYDSLHTAVDAAVSDGQIDTNLSTLCEDWAHDLEFNSLVAILRAQDPDLAGSPAHDASALLWLAAVAMQEIPDPQGALSRYSSANR